MVVVLILKIWVWFWPASCPNYISTLSFHKLLVLFLLYLSIQIVKSTKNDWQVNVPCLYIDAEELKRREIESVLATENSRLREELHRLRNLPPPVIIQQPVQVNLRPPRVTPQISCMNISLYFINASDVRPISLSQTVRSWSYWHSWREPMVESRHWNNRFDL